MVPPSATWRSSGRAPKSNGGKDITSYLYDVQTDSAGPWNGPFTMRDRRDHRRRAQCPSTNPAGGCKFRVYPVNSVGVGPVSNEVAGHVEGRRPPAPITAVTPGRPVATATIEWSAPADTGGLAVHYRYQVSGDGGAFVDGASTLPDSPRKANVECPGTNNCSYKIIAYNAQGRRPGLGREDHRVQRARARSPRHARTSRRPRT